VEGVFWWEEVVQEGFVDGDRVRSLRERKEPQGFLEGNILFGRPDIMRGCFGKKIGQGGSFGSFDDLEVSHLGLFGYEEGVVGLEFFSLEGGLCEFYAEGGKEGGSPRFQP